MANTAFGVLDSLQTAKGIYLGYGKCIYPKDVKNNERYHRQFMHCTDRLGQIKNIPAVTKV